MNTQNESEPAAPSRWFWPALIPLASGLLWLSVGWSDGWLFGLLATLPGTLLLATGTALLLWPGDRQISHFMAFGSVLSLLFSLAVLVLVGLLAGFLFAAFAAMNFIVAGYAALHQDIPAPGVPAPELGVGLAAKVAIDEALLAYFVASANMPTGARVLEDATEVADMRAVLDKQGWLRNPGEIHRTPVAPDKFELTPRKAGGQHFEHLRFDSGFEPHGNLPGAQRWQAQVNNRGMHAWVFQHAGPPRPWLMGIHGYRMGLPFMDFSLFDIEYLHRRLGLNLVLPILPLHGPRRAFKRSGSGFLDGNIVDMLHAETQAAWDLRRVLAWLRKHQSAPAVGVMGFSLGGYNTALLAGLDGDLACAIAGIPLTDMGGAVWRHMPELQRRQLQAQGLGLAQIQRVLTPVSPLALPPLVAPERRYIFAATGDQLVPTDQPQRLWTHWEEPEICWYHGSHLSVRREHSVRRFVASALANSRLNEDLYETPAGDK